MEGMLLAVGWGGMEWNGKERNGKEWDGMGWNGINNDGLRDGSEQNGPRCRLISRIRVCLRHSHLLDNDKPQLHHPFTPLPPSPPH